MGRAEDFTNLGEDMIAAHDARVDFLGHNIVDTHRFLNKCRSDHKAMGKKLRSFLANFVDELRDNTARFMKKTKKDNGLLFTDVHHFLDQCRQEGRKAHQSWQKVAKTMAAKRRGFNNQLKNAKQHASRTR